MINNVDSSQAMVKFSGQEHFDSRNIDSKGNISVNRGQSFVK